MKKASDVPMMDEPTKAKIVERWQAEDDRKVLPAVINMLAAMRGLSAEQCLKAVQLLLNMFSDWAEGDMARERAEEQSS